jgi:hypothetical protein
VAHLFDPFIGRLANNSISFNILKANY